MTWELQEENPQLLLVVLHYLDPTLAATLASARDLQVIRLASHQLVHQELMATHHDLHLVVLHWARLADLMTPTPVPGCRHPMESLTVSMDLPASRATLSTWVRTAT